MSRFHIITAIIGITVVAAAAVLFRSHKSKQKSKVIVVQDVIRKEHVQHMKVDAFIELMQKAYGSLINIEKDVKSIIVKTVSSNEQSADIYNGNTEWLGNHKDYGIEISYNNAKKETTAIFKQKDGTIFVPNDVVFAAMQKAYPSTSNVN